MKNVDVLMVTSIDKARILVTILSLFLILKEPIRINVLVLGCFILIGMILLPWILTFKASVGLVTYLLNGFSVFFLLSSHVLFFLSLVLSI